MEEALNILKDVLLRYWWIIIPIALFFILRKIWLDYIVGKFVSELKWILLEVKFPREVVKSPKAMEQIFAGLHAIQKTPDFKERYFKGMIPPSYSVEIIGREGKIQTFIRTQDKYRNLIESQIYAQYPDTEISEAEDYINILPADIPNQEYDVCGTELILTKPDAYPIRTYPVFFEEKEAEERIDPIAGLFEFLSSLNPQEHNWIQILISPADDKWKDEGEKLVEKLIGKKVKKGKKGMLWEEVKSWSAALGDGVRDFFFGPAGKPAEKPELESLMAHLTPGQREVVMAIEKNIAKLGYKTIIRYIYWAKKETFSKDKTAAIGGFFKQFNTQNLNGFKPNKKVSPGWGRVRKKRREINQKRFFVKMYRERYFPFANFSKRGFVFNTEELATIFHLPIKFVKVERMPEVEAKKGGPPTGLPTG